MDRVREALRIQFPEWAAAQQENQKPAYEYEDGMVFLDETAAHEFTISLPWVLRSDSLQEVFDEIGKESPVCNPIPYLPYFQDGLSYNPNLLSFRTPKSVSSFVMA